MKKFFTAIVVLVCVGLSVFSFMRAENIQKYYERKEIESIAQGEDPVLKAMNIAYNEVIDVAKETDLPVEDSFIIIKDDETVDIHILTKYGMYQVLSVEKPSDKEVLEKVTEGANKAINEAIKSLIK